MSCGRPGVSYVVDEGAFEDGAMPITLARDHLATLDQLSEKLNALMETGDADELRIYLSRMSLVLKRHIATERSVFSTLARNLHNTSLSSRVSAFGRDSASWTLAVDAFQETWCSFGAIERNRAAFVRATESMLKRLRNHVGDLVEICALIDAASGSGIRSREAVGS